MDETCGFAHKTVGIQQLLNRYSLLHFQSRFADQRELAACSVASGSYGFFPGRSDQSFRPALSALRGTLRIERRQDSLADHGTLLTAQLPLPAQLDA